MDSHDFHTPISIRQLLDAPTVVDLATAARALGIGRTLAYRLVRDNQFPVPVLRTGHHYRVPSATLLATLGLSREPAEKKAAEAQGPALSEPIADNRGRWLRRFSSLRREVG
ncbi:hypothetical protein [Actinocatenispora comari]|uniref:Helix-turn-helix domain-containing protein n=1 Tax=Actinocatenispora comari TaxID=2807577 RepID=A0A8J4A9C8_9ACTN|nr:hypothetical protein [Actinocatenispora comari]GIL25512.1 hypothetical protein NUM_07670 [Actinocatenispora comari]